MACVTRDSSPIPNRSLTQRRRAVMCWHNHQANTSLSLDVIALQPSHARDQVGFWRLQQQVMMVVHQHPEMDTRA